MPKRIKPEARIRVLVDGNPRRPGTRNARLFSLYRRARTVREFLERGRKLTSSRRKSIPRPAAIRDVRYDVEHRYIALR